jgi:hypothetical protein
MADYPNNSAVPGNTWPGAAWPGQPLNPSLGLYQFGGPVTLIYVCYIDAAAGHTLVAVPGQIYDIQTPVLNLPAVPVDGLWTAVEG